MLFITRRLFFLISGNLGTSHYLSLRGGEGGGGLEVGGFKVAHLILGGAKDR